MIPHDFLKLLAKLSEVEKRPQVAKELAHFLHAEDLIIFLPDLKLDILLPGPGFPQILANGKIWKAFLSGGKEPVFKGRVPYPDTNGLTDAVGVKGTDGSVVVLTGGNPTREDIQALQDILPLLAALFNKEQMVASSQSLAKTATQVAERAERLNKALDKVRQDLLNTLNENTKLLQALRVSEANYRSMIEGIPQMVWTTDAKGHFNFFSHNWGDYLNPKLAPNWLYILHKEDLRETTEAWHHTLKNGKEFVRESRLRRNDGQFRWHLIKAWASLDMDGNIIKWHGTCTDIHEQKQKNEKLASMNKELVKVNNDLDNFIYTASHDLKAPISNIEGLINYLSEHFKNQDIEKANKIFGLINKSIHRFKITIADLTEISKIQKQPKGNYEEHVSLYEVYHDVRNTLEPAISENKPDVILDFQVEQIRFSRKNMRSIMYNLLSNAIKYRSPERKPVVKISSAKLDNYTLLTVEDNGMGIKKEVQSKIFSMFSRGHHHVDGSGIGLYIVKRIIDDAEGKIELDSEEGEGAIFKVFFKNRSC